MRKFVLLAILAGAGWWHFIGGRTIDETHVQQFYQDLEHATLSRDPQALCKLLDNDFQSVGTISMGGRRVDFPSSLDVAGTLMNIRSRSTDTLLRTEGKGRIFSGG